MIPILYPADETDFVNRGLGPLSEAITCFTTEELNGEYELEMTFPVTGMHYSDITERCIIMAIPSPYRAPQPFRVYEIEAPLNGIVTVRARHISYDLSGIAVEPFTIYGNALEAMEAIDEHSHLNTHFTFFSDRRAYNTLTVSVPSSLRSVLGGTEDSVLGLWGGEFEFDRWNVSLLRERGESRNVTVSYGKNLTDFKMIKNLDAIITSIYPYWTDGETVVQVDAITVPVAPYVGYDNILPVDLSSEFEEQPTPNDLYDAAEAYIEEHDLTSPKVTFDVSFFDLASTKEYGGTAQLEKVDLGDTVKVVFPMYGIESSAKIVAVKTNVLIERYDTVTVGTVRADIATTIASLKGGSSGIYGGGGSGISNYNELSNKPSIGGVTLQGDRTLSELGIQTFTAGTGIDYTNNVLSIKDLYINCGTSTTVLEE